MDFDQYKTIVKPTEEVLFKDRNSKFYGYAFPVANEESVKEYLDDLKKKHHTAGHCCYAYRIGKSEKEQIYRANDDGEPNNSAGMPIYGQLLAQDLTNTLVAVVRYFGGTKLGVSGLINAYKTTADLAIQSAKIVTRTINHKLILTFDYPDMNNVMRVLKEENINILENNSAVRCKLLVSVRLKEVEHLKQRLAEFHKVEVSEV